MKDETKLEIIKELAKGNVKIAQLILEVQGDNNYYENRNKEENNDPVCEGSTLFFHF